MQVLEYLHGLQNHSGGILQRDITSFYIILRHFGHLRGRGCLYWLMIVNLRR